MELIFGYLWQGRLGVLCLTGGFGVSADDEPNRGGGGGGGVKSRVYNPHVEPRAAGRRTRRGGGRQGFDTSRHRDYHMTWTIIKEPPLSTSTIGNRK